MLKRLLNRSEEMTDARLRAVCEPHGVRVFAKVRLADIFPIEDSGITPRAYSFALRSHIDFLVVDEDYDPIFGAEFDGPRHGETIQVQRDVLKRTCAASSSCRYFALMIGFSSRAMPIWIFSRGWPASYFSDEQMRLLSNRVNSHLKTPPPPIRSSLLTRGSARSRPQQAPRGSYAG